MKRQSFRLGSVLRYNELQKKRAEAELQDASRLLHETEAEIARLDKEITDVAALLHGRGAAPLTITALLACQRKIQHLDQRRSAARERRQRQEETVAKLREQRKHWAVKEESLLSLRRSIEDANREEAAKEQQILAEEAALRRWLDVEPE